MTTYIVNKDNAARACLELAGGGYNFHQVAKGMELQYKLMTKGRASVRRKTHSSTKMQTITLVLQDDAPDSDDLESLRLL